MMRKIVLLAAIIFGLSSAVNASKYMVDENSLDNMISKSTEISFEQKMSADFGTMSFDSKVGKAGDTKTRGGYLVRAFFCGSIALHRYYMGTGKKAMWAMYLLIPVVGAVDACVDFWWVVFDKDAMNKYANNDKYIVWL
jgi:hypothetical protein